MGPSYRCLVCGYVASGEAPPPACPVCGAGADQFAPVGRGKLRFLQDLVATFLPHAVAAHIPNGALPAAVLFLLLALATGSDALERTAFHLLVLTVIVTPVSLLTGVYDWKHRYHGRKVPVFYRKIALAAALFLAGATAAGLRASRPELLSRGGTTLALYVALVFFALGAAILLGHYGGKLVFYWQKR